MNPEKREKTMKNLAALIGLGASAGLDLSLLGLEDPPGDEQDETSTEGV